jgi:TatD DNase family protein
MNFIDSHTHLYLEHFDEDRQNVIEQAIKMGVSTMLLPAIDKSNFDAMQSVVHDFPENCLPMIGLHPTSVDENVEEELAFVEAELKKGSYIAIGEIGIDLYWDKSFKLQQTEAFRRQLRWAKKYQLPVAIHMRDSFNEVYEVVKEEAADDLKGVFHCFIGTVAEAKKIIDLGFYLGIGGVVTFKNSGLGEVVADLPLEHLLLETDAPFLTPTPFRGKRNDSSYIPRIAQKIADLTHKSLQEVADVTTQNTKRLFNLT